MMSLTCECLCCLAELSCPSTRCTLIQSCKRTSSLLRPLHVLHALDAAVDAAEAYNTAPLIAQRQFKKQLRE